MRFIVYWPSSIVLTSKMAFFSKIFVLILVLFYTGIQIHTVLCSFSIRNGSTSRTPQKVHHFSAKSHRFDLRNSIFFKNFRFDARFILRQNSDLCKLVQLFDWKQEVHHFLAKFQRFRLQNGIFSKIFVSVIILFCARIQIHTNLCSFSFGKG